MLAPSTTSIRGVNKLSSGRKHYCAPSSQKCSRNRPNVNVTTSVNGGPLSNRHPKAAAIPGLSRLAAKRHSENKPLKYVRISSRKDFVDPVNKSVVMPTPEHGLYANARLLPVFRGARRSLAQLVQEASRGMLRVRSTTPTSCTSRRPWLVPGSHRGTINQVTGAVAAQQQRAAMSRAYTPSAKSRVHKMRIKQKEQFEGLVIDTVQRVPLARETLYAGLGRNGQTGAKTRNSNRIEVSATLDAYLKAPAREDPYRQAEAGAKTKTGPRLGRGGVPAKNVAGSRNRPPMVAPDSGKTIDPSEYHLKATKCAMSSRIKEIDRWKKHFEESADNGSTTTNKSSAFAGKANYSEEKDDSCSDEERLTVIEKDCDNDYSLIFSSLQDNYNNNK